jgi:nucleoside phosphorylase
MSAELSDIGIFVALPQEAEPIVRKLSLAHKGSLNDSMPAQVYSGKFESLNVSLWTAGVDKRTRMPNIGPELAFCSTMMGVDLFSPQVVLNAGTAGGFGAKGARIGDVYLGSHQAVFHDRRSPVAKYEEFQKGRFPILDSCELATKLGCKQGIVSSGVSFDHDARDCETARNLGASLIDMEASSCAWACSLHNVPFLPVKVVTDLVDEGTGFESQFYENWVASCDKLAEFLPSVILELHRIARGKQA